MSTQNNNDKQQQFHEALTYIVESANMNNGIVTLDEIHKAFDDIIEDSTGYEHIYNYLLENKITINDHIIHHKIETPDERSTKQDEEEHRFVELYKEEVSTIRTFNQDETYTLLSTLLNPSDIRTDNNTVKSGMNQLIEGHLGMVLSIAETYERKGVTTGDLIQEGNLGLIEGISTYIANHSGTTPDVADFYDYIKHAISQSMSNAISLEHTSSRIGNHIADHANRLDQASVELSQDLGRTPTVEELAKFLSISSDEVERIMKMSLDALNADNADAELPSN